METNRNLSRLEGKKDNNKSHPELDLRLSCLKAERFRIKYGMTLLNNGGFSRPASFHSVSPTPSYPKVSVGHITQQQQRQALKTLNQVQGDLMITTTRGFTLIELLVVVLIIGILAAVALPQYNKAVRKAKFTEVSTMVNSISKAIDLWLIGNDGFPSSTVQLSGSSSTEKLDIEPSCGTLDAKFCYTNSGRWVYSCTSDNCSIRLETLYQANKSATNKWLDESVIYFYKRPNQAWGMGVSEVTASTLPDVCRWWKSMYGSGHVINSNGAVNTACDAY